MSTPAHVKALDDLERKVGELGECPLMHVRNHRAYLRTLQVQGSCAIESNPLTVEDVRLVHLGRRPANCTERHIQEIETAFKAYNCLNGWNPYSEKDLLDAHGVLMEGLMDGRLLGAGRYRTYGVYVGTYRPPHAKEVPGLMTELLDQIRRTGEHPLTDACEFHYRFEGVHPFGDGNGRMGRLWQTLIASRWEPLFAWVPVEPRVFAHRMEYYDALSSGKDTFMSFMYQCIDEALDTAMGNPP